MVLDKCGMGGTQNHLHGGIGGTGGLGGGIGSRVHQILEKEGK